MTTGRLVRVTEGISRVVGFEARCLADGDCVLLSTFEIAGVSKGNSMSQYH